MKQSNGAYLCIVLKQPDVTGSSFIDRIVQQIRQWIKNKQNSDIVNTGCFQNSKIQEKSK